MAANNEALLNSFANLLRTLTPAQVSSISASLQAASATTLRPLNADDMTPMVEDKNEPTAAELEAQLEGKRKLSRAQRRMAVIENHKKTTKRPLNGFIAYRSKSSTLQKTCFSSDQFDSILQSPHQRRYPESEVWFVAHYVGFRQQEIDVDTAW